MAIGLEVEEIGTMRTRKGGGGRDVRNILRRRAAIIPRIPAAFQNTSIECASNLASNLAGT